jgi:hypothetical protein
MSVELSVLIPWTATNADEDDRIADVDCDGKSRLLLEVQARRASSISAVTITPYISVDGGSTYSRMTSRAVDSGAGTLHLYTDALAITDNVSFCVEYDVEFASNMRFKFAFTGAHADDKFQARVGMA